MQGGRDFTNALVIAIISIGLILGALSISLVEFVPEEAPTATNNVLPSPVPLTITPTATFPILSLTPSLTLVPTSTSTLSSNCAVPFGWAQIIVQAGDTVESIAAKYRIAADDLRRGNCLLSNSLVPGSKIYVPPIAPNTSAACAPGKSGWVKNYIVKSGDNLYRIGVDHYTTLELMRKVNCKTSDTIFPGEVLWVPNISATQTPNPTSPPGSTVTSYPTDPVTETVLPFTATFVPTTTASATSP